MRNLSNEPCIVTFLDNIGGGKITLKYRMPITAERIEYSNSHVSRKGKKIESCIGDTRHKFGAKILVGITDGDFQKGNGKPLSSNPTSLDYDEKWKEIICEFAPDVIALLALHAFDNPLAIDLSGDDENPS